MKASTSLSSFVLMLVAIVSANLITKETETQPTIEKTHIASPSALTELMHYFNHAKHFALYPNFMTSMPVDISESGQDYLVHVDLPGVQKSDLKIAISPAQHELQISAYKSASNEVVDHRFKRIERYTGHMTRTMYLPDYADLDKISAAFKDGVLEIKLPKVNSTCISPDVCERKEIMIEDKDMIL
jgi:HSP20 family protein